MEEKDILELSNDIINCITKLSLGEKPGMLSGKVFKNLHEHSNFKEIKKLYANHLLYFQGVYENTDDLKKLTDLRYKLVELYLD
jgi:hypothetical protein